LNGSHHLLVYVDDVNILGKNANKRKGNIKVVSGASVEVGQEVNIGKTKHMQDKTITQ
jgi:hypothetical protein